MKLSIGLNDMRRFLLFTASVFISISTAFAGVCSLSGNDENALLSTPFDGFDQAENGWRKFAESGCYHETGILIEKYIEQHKSDLVNWQRIALTWHTGQMYAFNNEYQIAKKMFEDSINLNPQETEISPILWNEYVNATIAFLDKDMPNLKMYRERIANGPMLNGKKANLDVVDHLIKYFNEPYSRAYRSHD